MPGTIDAVVIGGGINGLAAAAFLARSGRGVVVCEARDVLGGLAAREELHPGFHAPGVLHDASGARRELLAPLGLEHHGLVWRDDEPPLLVTHGELSTLLDPVQGAYAEWRERIAPFRAIAARVLDERPPDVASASLANAWEVGRTALRIRRLGERDMLELARIAPMPAADWLCECFAHEAERAGLAATALIGTTAGPRAAGTSATLLLREGAAGPEPRGGPAALVDALAAACRAEDVELRTSARVERIRVERGAAAGVRLEGGETVDAPVVLSGVDFRTTVLDLLEPRVVPLELERAARVWKAAGALAAVRLALDAPPVFGDHGTVERAVTAGSLDELERAADHLKYGTLSDAPWLDVRVPSVADPSLAPAGMATVSVLVHCAPRDLAGGWDDAARGRLGAAVVSGLERAAPGTRERVLATRVLTPADLEQRYGLAGGHVFHGEHALDQLWFQRPALSCARYATPIAGLFLCGSSSHPGGGFLGGPGTLAAAAVIEG